MAMAIRVGVDKSLSTCLLPLPRVTCSKNVASEATCRAPNPCRNPSFVTSQYQITRNSVNGQSFGNSFQRRRMQFTQFDTDFSHRRYSSAVDSASFSGGNSVGDGDVSLDNESAESEVDREDAKNWWKNWQRNATELRQKVAKLGISAILAYGLFDGVTYTTFFVLAFLGYETSTGKNPAANIKSLLGIVVAMWAGNNVTRPFRVAGAAALAPLIDRGLRRLKELLNLPNITFAFMLVVSVFSSLCFSVVGLLILSRLGN